MFAFDKIFTFSFGEKRFVFEFFKDVRIGVLVFLRFCNGLWSAKLARSTGSRRTLLNSRSGVQFLATHLFYFQHELLFAREMGWPSLSIPYAIARLLDAESVT